MSSVERLRAVIRAKFPSWNESRSLMKQLPSIELVELIETLETEFGVRFSPVDLEEANFENATALHALLTRLARPSV